MYRECIRVRTYISQSREVKKESAGCDEKTRGLRGSRSDLFLRTNSGEGEGLGGREAQTKTR